MLFSCTPLFLLLHQEKIQKFEDKFFSNSSTFFLIRNIVANSNYSCQYIVYDSLCFGGSYTKSNIVCLAMLVPQIQCICIITCGGYHPSGIIVASLHKSKRITIITITIDLSNLYYFHLHNFYINSNSWHLRKKSIETIVINQLHSHKKCRI